MRAVFCRTSIHRWSMTITTLALSLLISTAKGERTYTDAKGDVFTIAEGAAPPKIIINANGALSLFHLGLPSSQLVAVYDHWVIRGSMLDLEDPTGEFETEFGIDPTAEEIAFLKEAENLTPECTVQGTTGCHLNFDATNVENLDYDFVVLIRAGIGTLSGVQNDLGHNVIWIDDKYEHNTGCYGTEGEEITLITNEENCYSRSLIDVVVELEELIEFLGVEQTDAVQRAKQDMCESAANFVAHSQDLHERGIYAAAVSFRPFNGITMNWFTPHNFPWLRTLEELGFPIVHAPNTTSPSGYYPISLSDWFVNCDTWPVCQDGTGKMSIDLWLLDSRSYASILSDIEGSKQQFPDPAFVADQFSYWQFNDGAISYVNIARYLDDIVAATSALQRVHTDPIACEENVDVTSSEYNNRVSGGISGGGTFACYGDLQSLYTECPVPEEEDPPPASFELCFSGSSLVEVQGKGAVKMEDLVLGDAVQVSSETYEPIYSFGHKSSEKISKFLQITTEGSRTPLEISPDHMVVIEEGKYVPASLVKKGDKLLTVSESNKLTAVLNVKTVVRKGAFAPFTTSGTIVVNGIVASNYIAYQGSEYLKIGNKIDTPLSYQWVSHAFNSIHRMAVSLLGVRGETYTAEGVSQWVNAPHQIMMWVLKQPNTILSTVLIGLALFIVSFMRLVEMILMMMMSYPNTTVVVAILIGFFLCVQYQDNQRMRKKSI